MWSKGQEGMSNQDRIKQRHDFVRALHDAANYDRMKKQNDYLAKRRAIADKKRQQKQKEENNVS